MKERKRKGHKDAKNDGSHEGRQRQFTTKVRQGDGKDGGMTARRGRDEKAETKGTQRHEERRKDTKDGDGRLPQSNDRGTARTAEAWRTNGRRKG